MSAASCRQLAAANAAQASPQPPLVGQTIRTVALNQSAASQLVRFCAGRAELADARPQTWPKPHSKRSSRNNRNQPHGCLLVVVVTTQVSKQVGLCVRVCDAQSAFESLRSCALASRNKCTGSPLDSKARAERARNTKGVIDKSYLVRHWLLSVCARFANLLLANGSLEFG